MGGTACGLGQARLGNWNVNNKLGQTRPIH